VYNISLKKNTEKKNPTTSIMYFDMCFKSEIKHLVTVKLRKIAVN